jgi:hypothetical protein
MTIHDVLENDSEATVEAQVGEAAADGAQVGARAVVPGLGTVTPILVRVGPSNTRGLRLTITGLQFTSTYPPVVLLSARQGPNENQELNFPDVFGVQVIRTTQTTVRCRVFRLDGDGGWGQDLHLSGLVVG